MGLPQTGSFPIYVQTACDFTEHDSETTGSERAQEEQKVYTYTTAPLVCSVRPHTKRKPPRNNGMVIQLVFYFNNSFLVVGTAGLANSVRHHQGATFAAFYEIRSAHFPVRSSFISSSFG